MKILYVDDELLAIRKFEAVAANLDAITELHCFSRPEEALAFARSASVDAAFLDIEMPGMRGIDLAEALTVLDANIRIFFVTAYDQYALDAFGVNALGYLLKPYTLEMLARELDKARRMHKKPSKAVYIQTIPSFDVYIDGELYPITSPKPKELLALLVDRNGGTVSSGFAIAQLWEDKPDDEKTKALYRMTLKRLREILAAAGIEFILSAEGSAKFIRPDTFTCDYFQFLQGDAEVSARYNGEYLSEYSWAEETNARLTNLKESRENAKGW
ncbi:MAG: response regulator [Clostridiales bacterium]|nr:response regulator [Clostridiales bacterium]